MAPGKCRCSNGFSGLTCRIATIHRSELTPRKVCSPECANGGKCRRSGKCKCPAGYSGPACEEQGERRGRRMRKGRRGRKGDEGGKKERKRRKKKRTSKARNLIQQYLHMEEGQRNEDVTGENMWLRKETTKKKRKRTSKARNLIQQYLQRSATPAS